MRADLESARYRVAKVTKSERKRNAPAPYTTSKLQQDAVNRLGFGAKRTMQIAQGLYEGVDLGKHDGGPVGLITYMRTDSTRVSPDAVQRGARATSRRSTARSASPRSRTSSSRRRTRRTPTRPSGRRRSSCTPESVRKHLKDEQFKLYKLIWERFVASQMTPAVYDQTSVDIEAQAARTARRTPRTGCARAGAILKFAGWLEAYGKGEPAKSPVAGEGDDAKGERRRRGEREAANGATAADGKDLLAEDAEASCPSSPRAQALSLVTPPGVITEQKFTQPPAALQRRLARARARGARHRPPEHVRRDHQQGAGARLRREARRAARFQPDACSASSWSTAWCGASSTSWTRPSPSKMEEELDEVGAGKRGARRAPEALLQALPRAARSSEEGQALEPGARADRRRSASRLRRSMLKRWRKNGWFLGCANYPECKGTRDLGADGDARRRRARRTSTATSAASRWSSGAAASASSCRAPATPSARTRSPVPLGVQCPKCGGDIIEIRSKKRGGRTFYGCSNYANEPMKCDFKLWQKPIPRALPQVRRAVPRHGRHARPSR